MHRDKWTIHFIEEDCKTSVVNRYFAFATLHNLRDFVIRCNAGPAELDDFDHSVKAWGRGSTHLTLTDEQYVSLKKCPSGSHAATSTYVIPTTE
ncbi:hypothetical protein HDF14_005025 [Edaphobacter lichenicola]|uniref:Uncharacterized protein n=1 Tax=Tunturiibacter gelidiferens TaxID=3069689 RepID=A0A9X0QJ06_9BACT|nr:hypothetical protein [Edaphobacter lichenicola]